MFTAARGDIVLVRSQPHTRFLGTLAGAGITLPEFVSFSGPSPTPSELLGRPIGGFYPWGVTPRTLSLAKAWGASEPAQEWASTAHARLYSKTAIFTFRKGIRTSLGDAAVLLGEPELEGQVVRSCDDVVRLAVEWRARWNVPTVVKAPYGASGQNAMRFSGQGNLADNERGWLQRVFDRHGEAVAEPWLAKVEDFSAQLRLDLGRSDPVLAVTRFLTDSRGQYSGHVLGKAFQNIDPGLRRALHERCDAKQSLVDVMKHAANHIALELQNIDFSGPASADMFVYRHPLTGKLRLRALGEINPRFTMGHIALSIQGHLRTDVSAYFIILGRRDLERAKLPDFKTMAAEWQRAWPLVCDAEGRWAQGRLFITDPEKAKVMAAAVVIGTWPEVSE
jgi:hypothetical protein